VAESPVTSTTATSGKGTSADLTVWKANFLVMRVEHAVDRRGKHTGRADEQRLPRQMPFPPKRNSGQVRRAHWAS
jgi:hypothetical protein